MRSPAEQPTIPLFLYGTLRPGGAQHGLVAPFVVSTVPAQAWGCLYHVPAGYPALDISPECIIARGTHDPLADTAAATLAVANVPVPPPGACQWIRGDWVELREPARCLPQLDDYEDFRANAPSLYERVLIAVEAADGPRPAWVYTKAPEPGDVPVLGRTWNAVDFPPG